MQTSTKLQTVKFTYKPRADRPWSEGYRARTDFEYVCWPFAEFGNHQKSNLSIYIIYIYIHIYLFI